MAPTPVTPQLPHSSVKTSHAKGWLGNFLMLAAIWGSSFLFMRQAIASVFLLPSMLDKGHWEPSKRQGNGGLCHSLQTADLKLPSIGMGRHAATFAQWMPPPMIATQPYSFLIYSRLFNKAISFGREIAA